MLIPMICIASYLSPYWALFSFANALSRHDASVVNNLIDFQSVKDDEEKDGGKRLPSNLDGILFKNVPESQGSPADFACMAATAGSYKSFDSFACERNGSIITFRRNGPFSWKIVSISNLDQTKSMQASVSPDKSQLEQEPSARYGQSPTPSPIPSPTPNPTEFNDNRSSNPPESSSTSNSSADSTANNLAGVDFNEVGKQIKNEIESVHGTMPQKGDTIEADRINKLGLAELKGKNYSQAAGYFKQANQTDPSDAKYLSNEGFAEMNAGDLDSAKKHMLISLDLAPDRLVAWEDLAQIYAKQHEQPKAVSCIITAYKMSSAKVIYYLQSLATDEDPAIVELGTVALKCVSGADPTNYRTQGSAEHLSPGAMVVNHFSMMAKDDRNSWNLAYADLGSEWQARQSFKSFMTNNQGKWFLKGDPQEAVQSEKMLGPSAAQIVVNMRYFSNDNRLVRFVLEKKGDDWKFVKGTSGTDPPHAMPWTSSHLPPTPTPYRVPRPGRGPALAATPSAAEAQRQPAEAAQNDGAPNELEELSRLAKQRHPEVQP